MVNSRTPPWLIGIVGGVYCGELCGSSCQSLLKLEILQLSAEPGVRGVCEGCERGV